MKKIVLLLMLLPSLVFAQKATVSGTVTDKATGEQLIQANIYDPGTFRGTSTNYYGFYSLGFDTGGMVTFECSYVGYETQQISFLLTKDTTIDIMLDPTVTLQELTVSDKSPMQTVESAQMSVVSITPKQAKAMPVLFGEVDILKTLQMMPGVAAGTEGTAGIYVRGGGPDQNLFLLDGVPVYNVSHALGIFSVFNADAVKNVDLIKGGFPARYGGRLSSVVDIRMKEGNMNEIKGNASIGLISSKFMIEGPIKKGRTSFIVSARRTYADMLISPLVALASSSDESMDTNLDLYFYDLNAKINHKFSAKDRLYLSVYTGRDVLGFNTEYSSSDTYYDDLNGSQTQINTKSVYDTGFKFLWGNITSALRWNHIFNSKLFSNTTLTFTDYRFKTGLYNQISYSETGKPDLTELFDLTYFSNIHDYAIKLDFDYIPNDKHTIKFGGSYTYHSYTPGATTLTFDNSNIDASLDTTIGNTNIPAHEMALYAEDSWLISNNLKANIGLHFSGFQSSETFYSSLQPRLSIRYKVDNNKSLKASFATMTQYLNLLASSMGNLPTDIWVPSTGTIKPQESWQAALGGAWAIDNNYEITLEGYYKKMENLVEYREGESFFFVETDWEQKVTQGQGEAYGVELMAQKTQGKLNGWVAYTWSKSNRRFDEINGGKSFPYKYDRRHDMSVVAIYQLGKSLSFNAAFQLNTGNAFTLYDQKLRVINSPDTRWGNPYDFMFGQNPDNEEDYTFFFEDKNSYRMPLYHRLDVGITYTFKSKKVEHVLNLSVYNLYGRQNPTFIFPEERYDYRTNRSVFTVRQFSILAFPLPSISYEIKF